jgi:hypothetical protein
LLLLEDILGIKLQNRRKAFHRVGGKPFVCLR